MQINFPFSFNAITQSLKHGINWGLSFCSKKKVIDVSGSIFKNKETSTPLSKKLENRVELKPKSLSASEIKNQLLDKGASQSLGKAIAELPDAEFVGLILSLLEDEKNEKIVDSLFEIDHIQARSSSLSTSTDFMSVLSTVVKWMEKHPKFLKKDVIQRALSDILVQLVILLDSSKSIRNDLVKNRFLNELTDCLYPLSQLPLSLQQPIQHILKSGGVQLNSSLSSKTEFISTSTRRQYLEPGLTPTKKLAISVANEIEGYDFRTNGIRLRVHQNPGPDAGIYVSKHLDSFIEGKRNFIFDNKQSVPLTNYKTVMLYVIDALEHDRKVYYKKHPKYIDETLFLKSLEQKSRDERFEFERVARLLIDLKPQVNEAKTENEIHSVLEQFEKIYCKLPNHNMNMTICSALSPHVFNINSQFKPIIISKPPKDLIQLAEDLKDNSSFNLTNKAIDSCHILNNLLREVTPDALEKLTVFADQFQKWWTCSKESKIECYKPLLDAWADIPPLENLPSELKYPLIYLKEILREVGGMFHYRQPLYFLEYYDLSKPLMKVGIDYHYLEDALTKLSKIHNETQWRDAAKDLYTTCQQKIDNSKNSPSEKINDLMDLIKPEIHWKKVHEEEVVLLNRTKITQENLSPYLMKSQLPEFTRLINELKDQMPQDEYNSVEKHEINKDRTESTKPSLSSLEELFHATQTLRSYIRKEILTVQKDQKIIAQAMTSLQLLDKLDQSTAQEAANLDQIEDLEKALKLVTTIAVNHSYFDNPFSGDLLSLKKELTTQRDQMLLGYRNLKQKLWNSSSENPDEQVQLLMGTVNDSILGSVSRILAKLEQKNYSSKATETSLSGFSTTTQTVHGTLRIIKDLSMLKSAKQGEILVIPTLPPHVEKYRNASAVISQAGGIFSHAAIDLREMNIPSLIGCQEAYDKLTALDGKAVTLKLSIDDINEISPCTDINLIGKLGIGTKKQVKVIEKNSKEPLVGKSKNLLKLSEYIPSPLEFGSFNIAIPAFVTIDSDYAKAFFEQTIEGKSLKQSIIDILKEDKDATTKSQSISKLLDQTKLDENIKNGLQEHFEVFQKQNLDKKPFIVRSSGETEDGGKTSLAGLFKSVGNLKSIDEYFEGVQKVWKSAFSLQAIDAFCESGAELETFFSMSVVLQEYLDDGTFSGVAFSDAGRKSEKTSGIQVVDGLGGGVKGKQRPATVFVKTTSDDEQLVTHGTMGDQKKLGLSPQRFKDLSRFLKTLESVYEYPVEVEFVIKSTEKITNLFLVQLRPITVRT